MSLFIGVDVGSRSVRAAVVDSQGKVVAKSTRQIKTTRMVPNFVEQCTVNIWDCTVSCLEEVVRGVDRTKIKSIGFDATCSLVALNKDDKPVQISKLSRIGGAKDEEPNVISWMDQRAGTEAEEINAIGGKLLKYVGGSISPEMQLPKLLWMKKHIGRRWGDCAKLMDLSDYLVYAATGVDRRSVCTTTCKWTYLSHANGWQPDFFAQIGLEEIVSEGYVRIGGNDVAQMGEAVGKVLPELARRIGISTNVTVAAAAIDAHAGALGTLGVAKDAEKALACICGTSMCCMGLSKRERFIPGVWGPYRDVVVPGLWLNEAGLSSAGSTIDYVLSNHSLGNFLIAKEDKESVLDKLNTYLTERCDAASYLALTEDIHVLPYFLGNRSPRADPSLLGAFVGLSMYETLENLAKVYLATIQALCYATRHIIETMNESGFSLDELVVSGGLAQNEVFLQELADITALPVHTTKENDAAVTVGAAILSAVACGHFKDMLEAMQQMTKIGRSFKPRVDRQEFHGKKYAVFHKMYHDFQSYRGIMKSGVRRL